MTNKLTFPFLLISRSKKALFIIYCVLVSAMSVRVGFLEPSPMEFVIGTLAGFLFVSGVALIRLRIRLIKILNKKSISINQFLDMSSNEINELVSKAWSAEKLNS